MDKKKTKDNKEMLEKLKSDLVEYKKLLDRYQVLMVKTQGAIEVLEILEAPKETKE
tara:strand:- start:237 stop:404 length:168 start_codon:yes stop_codon:yes gene_type:complete